MAACEEAVVGKRFAIVIPKSIREAVGLREGQRVLVRAETGRVVIELLPDDPYRVLEEVIGEPYDEASDEEETEEWLRRHAGR